MRFLIKEASFKLILNSILTKIFEFWLQSFILEIPAKLILMKWERK